MTVLGAHAVRVQIDGAILLEDCSCTLERGRMLGICGPNGAGKSTLLRVLAGLLAPATGHVSCGGRPLPALPPRERALRLGYLAQNPDLAWPITVRELAALGRFPHTGEPAATAATAIDKALRTLGLHAFAGRNAQTLSGGERTRAHLARLLAGAHDFMLADEPTAALDPNNQLEVLALLKTLARDGLGIAIVLHELPLAAQFCDQLLVLHGGRVAAAGAPADILTPALLAEVFQIRGVWDAGSGMLLGFAALA